MRIGLLLFPPRRLLRVAHKSALHNKQAPLRKRQATEEQLLMVVQPRVITNRTFLRTVNELRSPGEINHVIPYRRFCGFTLFKGW